MHLSFNQRNEQTQFLSNFHIFSKIFEFFRFLQIFEFSKNFSNFLSFSIWSNQIWFDISSEGTLSGRLHLYNNSKIFQWKEEGGGGGKGEMT